MKEILSNRKWFIGYVWVRSIIAVGFFLVLFSIFLLEQPPLWLATVRGVFFSFFLLLIIFEILQKPNYLDIHYTEKGLLSISTYLPDTKTFFYLDKRRIHHFTIQQEDKLELKGLFKKMPWQQKLQIVVSKTNGEKFQSEILDVSWANKADLQRFYEISKRF